MRKLSLSGVVAAVGLGIGVAGLGLTIPLPAQAAGYSGERVIRVDRSISRPARNSRWSRPPVGSRRVYGRYWDSRTRWKVDPETRTVFAITPSQELWFLDPTSGWGYTIDRWGRVYTADPRSRWVYFVSPIHDWRGDIPYFFNYWRPIDGYYYAPRFDTYSYYYRAPRYQYYDYDYGYSFLWSNYGSWFNSPRFGRVTAFSYYDPYYVRWNGYYRDTYVDSRGYYWWEPNPISIWTRPNYYRDAGVIRPVYSNRPWERGLPESARFSSQQLANEVGANRGRDYGQGGRGGTVGFNVPLKDAPSAPTFDYAAGSITEAPLERSLPQFNNPSTIVPAVAAAAPIEAPVGFNIDNGRGNTDFGGNSQPNDPGRGSPVFSEPQTVKPRGADFGSSETIGSPTIIEQAPTDRGIDPNWGDPRSEQGVEQFQSEQTIKPRDPGFSGQRGREADRFADEPLQQAPQFEQPGIQDREFSSPRSEPQFEQPQFEQPRFEKPRDEPRFEQPRFEDQQIQQPQYEEPRFEQPRNEPRFEEPRIEQPREEPRFEQPRFEQPREEPRFEQPREERPEKIERSREIDNFFSNEENG